MTDEVTISPIEGHGYIVELTTQPQDLTVDLDTDNPEGYAVVVTDIEETENIEVVALNENHSVEVAPQDILGDTVEIAPVVYSGYIIEIFGGVQGTFTLPIEYLFSNSNVVNVSHGRYKNVHFTVHDDQGEPVVYHKVIRRENDFDVFMYPKETGKVIVYP